MVSSPGRRRINWLFFKGERSAQIEVEFGGRQNHPRSI